MVMRRLCVGFGGVWCVGRGVLLGAGGVGVDGVVRSTDLKMVQIFLAFRFLTCVILPLLALPYSPSRCICDNCKNCFLLILIV